MMNQELLDIARKGSGQYKSYDVNGYRHGTFSIRITRNMGMERVNWKAALDFSWGGREDIVNFTDLEAVEDYVVKMQQAREDIAYIERHKADMEREYQIAEEQRRQKKLAEELERQMKIEADRPVGEKLAKKIIRSMVNKVKTPGFGSYNKITVKVTYRGDRMEQELTCMPNYKRMALFNLGWSRISKDKAYKILKDSWIDGLDAREVDVADGRVADFLMAKTVDNKRI